MIRATALERRALEMIRAIAVLIGALAIGCSTQDVQLRPAADASPPDAAAGCVCRLACRSDDDCRGPSCIVAAGICSTSLEACTGDATCGPGQLCVQAADPTQPCPP